MVGAARAPGKGVRGRDRHVREVVGRIAASRKLVPGTRSSSSKANNSPETGSDEEVSEEETGSDEEVSLKRQRLFSPIRTCGQGRRESCGIKREAITWTWTSDTYALPEAEYIVNRVIGAVFEQDNNQDKLQPV